MLHLGSRNGASVRSTKEGVRCHPADPPPQKSPLNRRQFHPNFAGGVADAGTDAGAFQRRCRLAAATCSFAATRYFVRQRRWWIEHLQGINANLTEPIPDPLPRNVISIHVRHSDKKKEMDLLPLSYYMATAEKIRAIRPQVVEGPRARAVPEVLWPFPLLSDRTPPPPTALL